MSDNGSKKRMVVVSAIKHRRLQSQDKSIEKERLRKYRLVVARNRACSAAEKERKLESRLEEVDIPSSLLHYPCETFQYQKAVIKKETISIEHKPSMMLSKICYRRNWIEAARRRINGPGASFCPSANVVPNAIPEKASYPLRERHFLFWLPNNK